MKVDAMKKVIRITASLLLFNQVLATAQESPPPIDESTPIPTLAGTVTSFVAGQTVSIDISSTDHRTFQLVRVLEIIGADGHGANAAAITPGSTVTLHFMQDHGDFFVDRILLAQ
jgi:hypothetical protein